MDNQPHLSKWYYGIFPILIALFFLLGPFAFPLLWKSPKFNLFWKAALTLIVTLGTVYIFIGIWRIYQFALAQFKNLAAIS